MCTLFVLAAAATMASVSSRQPHSSAMHKVGAAQTVQLACPMEGSLSRLAKALLTEANDTVGKVDDIIIGTGSGKGGCFCGAVGW